MQAIANYFFERQQLGRAGVDASLAEIDEILKLWLQAKGAATPLERIGAFVSKTKASEGKYIFDRFAIGDDSLLDLSLQESSRNGLRFTTRVTVYGSVAEVKVFVSLQVETTGAAIAPSFIDAYCPKCVHDMLGKYPDWTRGGDEVPSRLLEFSGEEGGVLLANAVRNPSRVHPVVAVSKIDEDELWSGLGERIAKELVGLAQVIVIDDEASRKLSDELGRVNSCYLGAIRLYWPLSRASDRINSQVWTASRLLPADETEDVRAQDKFCSQLRHRLMSVSAVSTPMPKHVEEIRNSDTRRRLGELKDKGRAAAEAEELVEMLIAEKKAVIAEKEESDRQLAEAKTEIFSLRSIIEGLRSRKSFSEDSDDVIDDVSDQAVPPEEGEIRFYKKVHSRSNYDILTRVDDCGHTVWQNASKADKAKKGIIRLEKTDAWKLMQHCGTCTGGGMWRVKW